VTTNGPDFLLVLARMWHDRWAAHTAPEAAVAIKRIYVADLDIYV
jgi:hypothetical protein